MSTSNVALQNIQNKLNIAMQYPTPANVESLREALYQAEADNSISYDIYCYLISPLNEYADNSNVALQEFQKRFNNVINGAHNYSLIVGEQVTQLIPALTLNALSNSLGNVAFTLSAMSGNFAQPYIASTGQQGQLPTYQTPMYIPPPTIVQPTISPSTPSPTPAPAPSISLTTPSSGIPEEVMNLYNDMYEALLYCYTEDASKYITDLYNSINIAYSKGYLPYEAMLTIRDLNNIYSYDIYKLLTEVQKILELYVFSKYWANPHIEVTPIKPSAPASAPSEQETSQEQQDTSNNLFNTIRNVVTTVFSPSTSGQQTSQGQQDDNATGSEEPSRSGQIQETAQNIVADWYNRITGRIGNALANGNVTQNEADAIEQLLEEGQRQGIINANTYDDIIEATLNADTPAEAFINTYNLLVNGANKLDIAERMGLNIPQIPDPMQSVREGTENLTSLTQSPGQNVINEATQNMFEGVANIFNQASSRSTIGDFMSPEDYNRSANRGDTNQVTPPKPVPEDTTSANQITPPKPVPTVEETSTASSSTDRDAGRRDTPSIDLPDDNASVVRRSGGTQPTTTTSPTTTPSAPSEAPQNNSTTNNLDNVIVAIDEALKKSEEGTITQNDLNALMTIINQAFLNGYIDFNTMSAVQGAVQNADDLTDAISDVRDVIVNNQSSKTTSSVEDNKKKVNSTVNTVKIPYTPPPVKDTSEQSAQMAQQMAQVYASLEDDMQVIMQNLPNVISAAINTAMQAGATAANVLAQIPQNVINALNNVFTNIFNTQFISQQDYFNIINGIGNTMATTLSRLPQNILVNIGKAANNILTSLFNKGVWETLPATVTNILANIFRTLTSTFEHATTEAAQIFTSLFSNTVPELIGTMTNIANTTLAKRVLPVSMEYVPIN